MIAILRIPSNIKESAVIKAAGGLTFRSEWFNDSMALAV
jgi:hypothetical protein